jgi:hypothetical protein
MGFWRFNPVEPCCNPPAGYCQCTPCKWKVTDHNGYDPFILAGGEGEYEVTEQPYFQTQDLPQSVVGWYGHETLRLNGVLAPNDKGPPWRRTWQRAIPYSQAEAAAIEASHSRWVFGYHAWQYNVGEDVGFTETMLTWGLGIHPWADGTVPRLPGSSQVITAPIMYWWRAGEHNISGWERRWNCWGPNKLLLEFAFGQFNVPEDETQEDWYVIVEPDV